MKSVILTVIVFLSLALYSSCSVEGSEPPEVEGTAENPTWGIWQEMADAPLQLELEQTFGDNEQLLLPQASRIVGPVADEEENIYFIDSQKGTMYSYDPEGKVRWETGTEGKGPGNFQYPRGLVTDGEYLYTGNISGTRIDQFDLQGELVSSTVLDSLKLSFTTVEGIISDSLLVTSSTLWGKVGDRVVILNTADDMNVVNHFEILADPPLELGEGMSSDVGIGIVDNLIAAGNQARYAIRFYDHHGQEVRTIHRDFDRLVKPGYHESNGGSIVSSLGGLKPPLFLPQGYFLSSLTWPVNIDDPDQYVKNLLNDRENVDPPQFKHSLDLYDTSGTLLYSLENEGLVPETGTITYIGRQGTIYTKTDDPWPQIRRYRLTVSGPSDR